MQNIIQWVTTANKINVISNKLYRNMQTSPNKSLRSLVSKKYYEALTKEVIDIINSNDNPSFTTVMNKLYQNYDINQKMENFVFDKKITPGLVLTFGTNLTRSTIVCSNENENINHDTIFDIASTSKLLLSLTFLKLYEEGYIDLDKPVREYCPQFINLGNATIKELLGFEHVIETDGRIDEKNMPFKEIEKKLFEAKIINVVKSSNYSDIGVMILKYVVEKVCKEDLELVINDLILNPAEMMDTHIFVPAEKMYRVASNNNNMKVDKHGNIITQEINPGTPQDAKAQIWYDNNKAAGHAGYFSTAEDLHKLSKLINGRKILKKGSIEYLVKNEIGKKVTINNIVVDSFNFGKLVYAKQYDEARLGTSHNFSGLSFLSPGFTGTNFSVDYLNDLHFAVLSNRTKDRIWNINDEAREYIIKNEDGSKSYMGHYISSDYTAQIKPILKDISSLCLQYKILESLYNRKKEHDHWIRELKR